MSKRIILYTMAILFGYLSYRTIGNAWAQCERSKYAELKLVTVYPDKEESPANLPGEKTRWPIEAGLENGSLGNSNGFLILMKEVDE